MTEKIKQINFISHCWQAFHVRNMSKLLKRKKKWSPTWKLIWGNISSDITFRSIVDQGITHDTDENCCQKRISFHNWNSNDKRYFISLIRFHHNILRNYWMDAYWFHYVCAWYFILVFVYRFISGLKKQPCCKDNKLEVHLFDINWLLS